MTYESRGDCPSLLVRESVATYKDRLNDLRASKPEQDESFNRRDIQQRLSVSGTKRPVCKCSNDNECALCLGDYAGYRSVLTVRFRATVLTSRGEEHRIKQVLAASVPRYLFHRFQLMW